MSWLTWPVRVVGFLVWYAGQIISSSTAVLRAPRLYPSAPPVRPPRGWYAGGSC